MWNVYNLVSEFCYTSIESIRVRGSGRAYSHVQNFHEKMVFSKFKLVPSSTFSAIFVSYSILNRVSDITFSNTGVINFWTGLSRWKRLNFFLALSPQLQSSQLHRCSMPFCFPPSLEPLHVLRLIPLRPHTLPLRPPTSGWEFINFSFSPFFYFTYDFRSILFLLVFISFSSIR